MDPRSIARAIAAGRVAFGAACLLAPRLVARDASPGASGQLVWMLRAFGIRDIVLGTGALQSLADGDGAERWVTLGAVADTADSVAALVFHRELGRGGLAATLGIAVPAAGGGWYAAKGLAAES